MTCLRKTFSTLTHSLSDTRIYIYIYIYIYFSVEPDTYESALHIIMEHYTNINTENATLICGTQQSSASYIPLTSNKNTL